MKKERVIVIGGGIGGYTAALRAARLSADVTLIERENLGGVCLNKGCIPTKVFLHSASLFKEMKRASVFGISAENLKIDFSKISARKKAIVDRLTGGVAGLLRSKKVRVVKGTASFVDSTSLKVMETGEIVSGDKIILATGSQPAKLAISGCENIPILTSDDLLNMESVPKSMLLIGGGVIGVELGQFFSRLGVEVYIVEMLDRIVPTEDEDVSKALDAALSKEGIKIFKGSTIEKIEPAGKDKKVTLKTPQGKKEVNVAEIAQTIGRRPNYAGLDLEKIGIKTEKGRIVVDERMETNIPNIYAIGDIVGGIMLAHVAMAEGECAARNAMGNPTSVSYNAVPRCIYTSPEAACVGLSEKAAREQNGEVQVSRFPLYATGKALLMEETEGMVKIVADKKHGEILGVHIIGPHATEMIAEAVLAIGMEMTVDELARTIHPHPTVSEGIGESALILCGGAVHLP